MTNLEKIRAMSDEEFIRFIYDAYRCGRCAYFLENIEINCPVNPPCLEGFKAWLNSEVKE